VETPKSRLVALAATSGLVAGGLIIAAMRITNRGQAVFIPYAVLLLSLLVYFRWSSGVSFKQRFTVTLMAFMTATVLAYVYVVATVDRALLNATPLWKAPWPIAIFVLIGSISSAIVALAGRCSVRT
jgi:hypothetical protein